MTSASRSTDDKQTVGGLKLKIKFSKSKGFVSDLIEVTSPDTSTQGQLPPAASPQQQSTAAVAGLCSNQTRYSCRNWLDKSEYVEKSSLSDINAADFGLASQTSKAGSGHISVNGVNRPRPSLRFPVLHSFLRRAPFCIVPGEPTGVERSVRDEPGSERVEDVGVHYGQVLEDLEFLSSRQDEPDGGGECTSADQQRKQHLTASGEPTVRRPENMADICADSRRKQRAEDSWDDTREVVEISDEEPMSPFAIDCSLGLADEDFTFAASGQSKEKRRDCLQRSSTENPLFPWSVTASTQPKPCFPQLPGDHTGKTPARYSLLQATSKSETVPSAYPATAPTTFNTSAGGARTAAADRDGGIKRLIVVDCRNYTTTRHKIGESNNNNIHDFCTPKRVADTSRLQSVPNPPYADARQMMTSTLPPNKPNLLNKLLARKGKAPNALRDPSVSISYTSTWHRPALTLGSAPVQHSLVASHGKPAWHSPGTTCTATSHPSPLLLGSVTSYSSPALSMASYSSPALSDNVASYSSPALRGNVASYSSPALRANVASYSSPALRANVASYSSPALRDTVASYSSPALRDTVASYSSPALRDTVASNSSPALRDTVASYSSPALRDTVASDSNPALRDTVASCSSPALRDNMASYSSPALRGSVASCSSPALRDNMASYSSPALRDSMASYSSPALRDSVTHHARPAVQDAIATNHTSSSALCHSAANHTSLSTVRDTVACHPSPPSSHGDVATHASPPAARCTADNHSGRSLLLSPEMTFAVDRAIRDLDSKNQQSASRDTVVDLSSPGTLSSAGELSSPPGSCADAVSGNRPAGSSPLLNSTVDELKKRVGNAPASHGVLPTERPVDVTARDAPNSSAVEPVPGYSGIAKPCVSPKVLRKSYPPLQTWCRCEKPEAEAIPKEYKDVDGSSIPKIVVCKLCSRRLSKRWEKLRCEERPKGKETWCRCEQPDPYTPGTDAKEVCTKCQKTVSKKWKRQMAAKWCRCEFPIPSTVPPKIKEPGKVKNAEKATDVHFTCGGCLKLIHKEGAGGNGTKRTAGHKTSDTPTSPPITVAGPLGVFFQAMGDHNYSQGPSPAQGTRYFLVPLGLPVRQENAALLQQQSSHGQQLKAQNDAPPKQLVCVYPPQTNSGKNVYQPIDSDKLVVLGGNCDGHNAMDQTSTCAKLQPEVTPGTADTMVLPSEPQPECQTECVTEPPPDGAFFTCAFPGVPASIDAGEISSSSSVITGTSAGPRRTRSRPPSTQTQSNWHGDQPTALQGISKEIVHPCYVVMERMCLDHQRTQATPKPPCLESCRRKSLKLLCEKGQLEHCTHSSRRQTAQEQDDTRFLSWKDKRHFFRQHKSLEGYEEYRLRELERTRFRRLEEQAGAGGDPSSVGPPAQFLPLSSFCQAGTTNLRISDSGTLQEAFRKRRDRIILRRLLSDTGFSYPPDGESRKSGHDTETSLSEQHSSCAQQETDKADPAQISEQKSEENIVRKRTRKTRLGSDGENCEEATVIPVAKDRSSGVQMSKFNVKYYVFQAGDRAFLVPLISNRRWRVKRLDAEDLHYVKTAIGQYLAEKVSCARHLGYPDSIHLKKSGTEDSSSASSTTPSTTRQAFVAPTLGAETLSTDELRALISDRDFSRLVPKNARLSKSKYLEQIGEKVHMYLTGGSEETPDWIKDVARSMVMKQKNRVGSKKRLRPSKDITIEIDYAHEDELLDVGQDDSTIFQQSTGEYNNSAWPNGCSTAVYEGVDQTDLFHQELEPPQEHAFHPTGSFVCPEAYAQEEKKPLLGELMNITRENSFPGDSSVHVAGQQIMVPLPPSTGCVRGDGIPAVDVSQQPAVPESERDSDRKPLLGELLASSALTAPSTSGEPANENCTFDTPQEHVQQHSGAEQQEPPWSLAVVKQEPVDDGYSHAWSNYEQESNPAVSSDPPAPDTDPLPFISNSTFGRGVVQLEDDARCATPQQDDNTPAAQTLVKLEPMDDGDVSGVRVPLITSVVSGAAADLWENATTSNNSTSTDDDGSATATTAESLQKCLPLITSVAFGEVVSQAENPEPRLADASYEAATCGTDSIHEIKPLNLAGHIVGNANTTAAGHAGSFESELAQDDIHNLGGEEGESGESEQHPLPQISAVTYGEAARMWEGEDSGQQGVGVDEHGQADQVVHPTDDLELEPEVQADVPVISCVAFGDAVAHLEDEAVQDSGHTITTAEWEQAASCQDEDLDDTGGCDDNDNYHDQEECFKPEVKPAIAGAADGLVVAVPIVFPRENSELQTTTDAADEVPQLQIGVDLSIVKQEPRDMEEKSHFADVDGKETTHQIFHGTPQDETVPVFNTDLESINQHGPPNEHISVQLSSFGSQSMEDAASNDETLPAFSEIAVARDEYSTIAPKIMDTRSLASVLPNEYPEPSILQKKGSEDSSTEKSSVPANDASEVTNTFDQQSFDPTIVDVRSLTSSPPQESFHPPPVLGTDERQEKTSSESAMSHDTHESGLKSPETVSATDSSNATQHPLFAPKGISLTNETSASSVTVAAGLSSEHCVKTPDKTANEKGSTIDFHTATPQPLEELQKTRSSQECKTDSVGLSSHASSYPTIKNNESEASSVGETSDAINADTERMIKQKRECCETREDDGDTNRKTKSKRINRKRCSSKSKAKAPNPVSAPRKGDVAGTRKSTPMTTDTISPQLVTEDTARPPVLAPEPASSDGQLDAVSKVSARRTRLSRRSANSAVLPVALTTSVQPPDTAQSSEPIKVHSAGVETHESSTNARTEVDIHKENKNNTVPSVCVAARATDNLSESVEADQLSLAMPYRTTRRQASVAASLRMSTRVEVSTASHHSPAPVQKRSRDSGDIERTVISESDRQVDRTSMAQVKSLRKQREPRPRSTRCKKKPVVSLTPPSAPRSVVATNLQMTNPGTGVGCEPVYARLKDGEDAVPPKKPKPDNAEASVSPQNNSHDSASRGLKRKCSDSVHEALGRDGSSSSVSRADRSIFSALCSEVKQTSGSTHTVEPTVSVTPSPAGKTSNGNGDRDGLFSFLQASFSSSACESEKSSESTSAVFKRSKLSAQGDEIVKTVNNTAGLLSRGRRSSLRVAKNASAAASCTPEVPSVAKGPKHQRFTLSGNAAGQSHLRVSAPSVQKRDDVIESFPGLHPSKVSRPDSVCSPRSNDTGGPSTADVQGLGKPIQTDTTAKPAFSIDGLFSRLKRCAPVDKDDGGAGTRSNAQDESSTVSTQGGNDQKGLFSRLTCSLTSGRDVTTGSAGSDKCEGEGTVGHQDKDSVTSKGARAERSFFDCLPDGFLGAWKQ